MDDTRRITGLAAAGLLLCSSSGCLPRNSSMDVLQAQLRQNQEHLAELQEELQQTTSQLKTARREIDTLRTELAESGKSNLTPEQAASLVQITGIEVQPWLTGGVNRDEEPGDDALVIHFIPRDDQGEAVKLPGTIAITATDPSLPAEEQILGSWQLSPEECRAGWTRGWMGGGYQFTLPWQAPPGNSRVVVHVEYGLPDGRTFDDTELVKINPSPNALAKRQRSSSHGSPAAISAKKPAGKIHQAGRQETTRKPPLTDETEVTDEIGEPEDDSRPELPHSVNWTEETIPRFR